jgi:dUTPase
MEFTKMHEWVNLPQRLNNKWSTKSYVSLIKNPLLITIQPNKITEIYTGINFSIPSEFVLEIKPLSKNQSWKILTQYVYPSTTNNSLLFLPIVSNLPVTFNAGDDLCYLQLQPIAKCLPGKINSLYQFYSIFIINIFFQLCRKYSILMMRRMRITAHSL